MNLKHIFLSVSVAMFFALSGAITITTDRSNAIYKSGEEATFTVSPDTEAPAAQLKAVLSLDGGKKISETEIDSAQGGKITAKLDAPGVLQLHVSGVLNGKKVNVISGAAYDPEKITPAAETPADFDKFWENAIAEAKKLPLDPKVVKLDKWSNEKQTCYEVSVAAPGGRVYGMLTIPAGNQKYPLLLSVDQSGSGRNMPVLNQFGNRYAILWMSVHSFQPTLSGSERSKAYDQVCRPLHYRFAGRESRETYYFYRAVSGLGRLIDFVAERPEINKNKISAFGESQGAGILAMLAAFNPSIKALCLNITALCDHHGFTVGRRSGWPRLVHSRIAATSETAKYYDVINFCKKINVPVWMIAGLADTTCPPSGICAAFNVIPSAKKVLILEPGMGHSSRSSYGNSLGKMRVWVDRLPDNK